MSENTYDVLVIGGGIVGAGAALDAASRGMSVALVEARDWASGSSSRSSKLIHGGLRYLEQLDFRLVREALKERHLLLTRLAPHLVHPVPFLFPLKHRIWERFYIGAGMTLYDFLGGLRSVVPRHRYLNHRRALEEAPGLRPDALIGALQYFDGQTDDARMTLAVVRTAAAYGADVANRARATELLREGERVTGARVLDLESGQETTVRARQVISATGVWTDQILAMADTGGTPTMKPSKGVHLVVPRGVIDLRSAMILRTETSVLFVIPWGQYWVIGTTDTRWSLDEDHPVASRADIDYLLDHVNAVLRRPLTRDDIEGVYAGLRPLISGDAANTAKLSREHLVATPVPGLVIVAGGKYTTYRIMAEDAVDMAVKDLDGVVPESVTERVPLLGAAGYEARWNGRRRLAARSGLSVLTVERLLRRYGSDVEEVLEPVAADPTLGQPLHGAPSYLRAEVVYAASHEQALHLEDVLTRRTHISIEERDRGLAAAPEAAALMATVLGWDDDTLRRETENYRLHVEAEIAAERQPDDVAAEVILHDVPEPSAYSGAAETSL
ncbi:glycerol-3-phosphate dehydrogenase/oxidase [Streptosporangium sp. NBC_01756]|uniref:glycerol-3-phosphate dehydrogenase/oxidase n=1 Tax=Streptosporangium sp. NBC_01756 TaxID=2975950 RepID=UPI002DDBEA5A|nr:glycerol-3-phosphate dehydrogenase/oxidase [Streptosporangium sp. NBC_01756]WSC84709.1 glycerol-3-phosphate dehydrogenase/oxidase [Streptosporangium sp. NBC_01756]